jgi:hypothetical protein
MTRIRSIKPEIVEDEALGRCSVGAQLLFDRLILHADDYGNQPAAPVMLARRLFPHSEKVNASLVMGWLAELAAAEVAVLYAVRRQSFVHLPGWDRHQRVDHPGKPLCPSPDEADAVDPREDSRGSRESSRDSRSRADQRDQDQDIGRDRSRSSSRQTAENDAAAELTAFTETWNAACDPLPRLRKPPTGVAKVGLVHQAMLYFDGDPAMLAAAVTRAATDEHYRKGGYGFEAFCRHVERWGQAPVLPAGREDKYAGEHYTGPTPLAAAYIQLDRAVTPDERSEAQRAIQEAMR